MICCVIYKLTNNQHEYMLLYNLCDVDLLIIFANQFAKRKSVIANGIID